jgi:hypothetical protein
MNIEVSLLIIHMVTQNYIIYVSVNGIHNSMNHSWLVRTKEDTGWLLCSVFTLISTKHCSFEHTVATVFRAVGNICCDTHTHAHTHTHTVPSAVFQFRCYWDFTQDKINSECHISSMWFEIISFPEEMRACRNVFFYVRGSMHHNLYAYKKSNKMKHYYLGFIARPLYMFRILSVPIIRSTINCSLLPLVQHIFWYVVSVVRKMR